MVGRGSVVVTSGPVWCGWGLMIGVFSVSV